MQRLLLATLIATGMLSTHSLPANADGFLRRVLPSPKVEANPQGDYTLKEEYGPWLIMAMYFSGEEGEAKARELALDLRQNHNLNAFHWGMSFKQDEINPGRGIDNYGGKIRSHYRRGGQVTQYAVLVGHFPSLGDPEAQRLLEKIKQLTPKSLQSDGETDTAESLTNIDKFRSYVRRKNGKQGTVGPMSHAFVTRNPLLPKEYFVPAGIEADVAKWNSGQEYSLLKCSRKFTIKVATFKGRAILKDAHSELPDTRVRKPKEDDALVLAVQKAHKLAVALREKGWEAYEFHDRFESFVTVGSFDEGRQMPHGKIALQHRDAQIIIDTFGALKPNNIFNRPAQQDIQLEAEKKRQFQVALGQQGQVHGGFYPKRFIGLPFDIHPEAIAVPQVSVSSAYARAN